MSDIGDQIHALLDREHAALLAGDYASLQDIAPQKERLLTSEGNLAALGDPRDVMRKLDRNQTLLAMSISGIRSARGQVAAIGRQIAGFETYDRSGGKNMVGRAPSAVERKL